LAAGYLWLLFACLLGHLDKMSAHPGLTEDVARLADALSPAGIAVAVSFLAYLVGSFSQSVFESVGRAITGKTGLTGWARLSPRGHDALDDLLVSRVTAGTLDSPAEAGRLATDVVAELDLIKSRLLESKRDLFEEIDRLQGEADLRFAVLPPLAAVAIVAVLSIPVGSFGTEGATMTKCMLVFLVLLLMEMIAFQALGISRKANDKLVDAVLLEQVSAPALDRWERERGLT
jgi:hypothetical protein